MDKRFTFLKRNYKLVLYTLMIGCIIGLILGTTLFNKVEYEVVEKAGKPIYGTVYVGSPFKTTNFKYDTIESLPKYIFTTITKTIIKDSIVHAEIDSLLVLQDYLRRRQYEYVLFDNKYGKLTLNQSVQFNRLETTNYDFKPIERTTYKSIKTSPFIYGELSSNKTFGIGGGIRHKRKFILYKYNVSLDKAINNYHTLGSGIYFR